MFLLTLSLENLVRYKKYRFIFVEFFK